MDFGDFFSQIYPNLVRFFLEYFWPVHTPTNENIMEFVRAVDFKNGQKCYSDLENRNITMITGGTPSEIFCTGYLYAIPFS